MSEPTEKTLQDLYDWSDRLTGNWLDLGERLRRYADAWKADVEELRAEVEGLTQERDAALSLSDELTQARKFDGSEHWARISGEWSRRYGEMQAQRDHFRAEVERLRDDIKFMAQALRVWHETAEHLATAVEAAGAPPKRAYYETHEPPHCPTSVRAMTFYAFLWQAPKDKIAWPVIWRDRALAEREPFRVSEIVEVELVAKVADAHGRD